jgi:hypothetical protein
MPIGNSISSANQTLYRQTTQPINFNDTLLRKIASINGGAQTNSGAPISYSQLLGKSYVVSQISGTTTAVSAITVVNNTGNYVAGKTYGIITIQPGSLIGGTSVGGYGFYVQGFSSGDSIIIENKGYIVGAGGNAGGVYVSGQNGGPAMYVNSLGNFELYNTGVIAGGGAGGYSAGGFEDGQRPRAYNGAGGGGGGAGYVVGLGNGGQGGTYNGARGAPGQNGYIQQDGGTGWNFYPGGTGGGIGGSQAGGNLGSGYSIVGSNYLNFKQVGSINGPQAAS